MLTFLRESDSQVIPSQTMPITYSIGPAHTPDRPNLYPPPTPKVQPLDAGRVKVCNTGHIGRQPRKTRTDN